MRIPETLCVQTARRVFGTHILCTARLLALCSLYLCLSPRSSVSIVGYVSVSLSGNCCFHAMAVSLPTLSSLVRLMERGGCDAAIERAPAEGRRRWRCHRRLCGGGRPEDYDGNEGRWWVVRMGSIRLVLLCPWLAATAAAQSFLWDEGRVVVVSRVWTVRQGAVYRLAALRDYSRW